MKRFRMAVESDKIGDSSHLFFVAPHESPSGEWVKADVADALLSACDSALVALAACDGYTGIGADACKTLRAAIAIATNSD